MAPRKKSTEGLIDPIYQKFSKSVIRALGSTEFYEFFMDAISKANNEFQFSNRKMEKYIDLAWVDAIEDSLEGFQNIIANPRNIIREEEIIVNVSNAKKAGSDVVRHLAQHGNLVENFDEATGEVRPEKLMQKIRDDSTELYENRLVFTVLEHAFHFVKIRHDALFEAMSDEFGAKLKVNSDMESATEIVHVDMYLHIKEKDSAMEVDEKNRVIFDRIARMYRLLGSFMASAFAQQMAKYNRVRGNITRTNVLKKNPNYKKIVKLWEFLRGYDQVGYMIKITEQNPAINEILERDIYHNILFQYIILKGYLEDEKDRAVPAPLKQKKRKLKPKVIREIIEELTEDYDIPDLEIRKVLIEELTKEQLMQEEAAERLRLVEEQEQRKRAEEERLRKEKEAEEERIRQEKEAEEERIRMEREAEEKKRLLEKMEREMEDRRRADIFRTELKNFWDHLDSKLLDREALYEEQREAEKLQDYADAAKLIEEEEARKREEAERIRKRKEEEKEQKRLAAKAEKERIKREQEEAQYEQDMQTLQRYLEEINYFYQMLHAAQRRRTVYTQEWKQSYEEEIQKRKARQAVRQSNSNTQTNSTGKWRRGR